MAMKIEEKSQCCLCGKVLDHNKDFLLIPSLIGNAKDLLRKFSDVGVHEERLAKSKLKNKLIKHFSIHDNRIPPSEL